MYFGDPIMTPWPYFTNVAIGGLSGGTVNGAIALFNGKPFLDGTLSKSVPRLTDGLDDLAQPRNYNTRSDVNINATQTREIPSQLPINQNMPTLRQAPTIDGVRIAERGTNAVYQGFDETGVVRYVGITERAPAIRFGEHLMSGTERSMLRYRVVPGATNLSRLDARILEQTLINKYGLNNLLNVRNSIAPKYWNQYNINP